MKIRTMRLATILVLAGGCVLTLLPRPSSAQTCAGDLCACLGAAGPYAIVANDVNAKSGRVRVSGSSYAVGSLVDLDVCAVRGNFGGLEEAEADLGGNLILTRGVGTVAGVFKGYRLDGSPEAGAFVGGDLLTGGGKLKNPGNASVFGSTDTTGSRPEVADCRQAVLDAASTSAALRAMPGTSLGDIVVLPGQTRRLVAGNGLTVLNANSIVLKSTRDSRGNLVGGTLEIDFDLGAGPTPTPPATDPNAPDPNDPNAPDPNDPSAEPIVILNVATRINVGGAGQIVAGLNAGPEQILINVHGSSSKISVSKEATVEVPILAPNAKANINSLSTVSNLYASKVSLKGAEVTDQLACP